MVKHSGLFNTLWYYGLMALLQVILDDQRMKMLKQLALDRDTNVSELVRAWVEQIVNGVEKGTTK